MRIYLRQSLGVFAATLLVAGLVCVAHGQASRTLNTVERRIDTMNRQARDFERDNMGRDPKRKNDAEAAKRTRQVRAEIEEDLKSLQSLYNSSVTVLQASSELPRGFTTETARAIRKHALRLRTNLVLPALDETEARPAGPRPDTDRKTLLAICKVIYEFITNPIFDGSGAMDVKDGSKAKAGLEEIVRLGEHLVENSEGQ